MVGCEVACKEIDTDMHIATMTKGTTEIFHGMRSLFYQDVYGQIAPVYSISTSQDYLSINPKYAYLKAMERVKYVVVTDNQTMNPFEYLSRTRGHHLSDR